MYSITSQKSSQPKGTVIAQSVAGGNKVKKKTVVNIVVSTGSN